MRTKKLFGMKKVMRTMALGLAAMLVAGSLNVMEVEAAGVDGLDYPKYDTDPNSATYGTYIYNSEDVFGAATHVHLFGLEVTTTGVHTHGNIMAEDAWIGNSGMNDGKIAYPLEYHEVSYVGKEIHQIDSNVTGHLVLGPTITYGTVEDTASLVKISLDSLNGKLVEVKKGKVYTELTDPNNGTITDAVNIQNELNALKTLSQNWATEGTTNGTTISDLSSGVIETNQNEDPTHNIYINIPYSQWKANNDSLQITELDSNVNNRGIVVINIDAEGEDSIDLTCIGSGIVAKDSQNNSYSNSEHSTAAFGSCRVVYNIISNGAPYTGKVTFMNTAFGSILAPEAEVTVGAINGNVMAKKIIHTNQESHRLDIWPIFSGSAVGTHTEYDEIKLLLTLEGEDTTNKETGDSSQTTYSMYTYDKSSGIYSLVDENNPAFTGITATWNKTEGKYEVIISSSDVTSAINSGTLSKLTSYYLLKDSHHPEYQNNEDVYEAIINNDGTISYVQCDKTGADRGGVDPARDILTDVLVKTSVPNEKIQINVEFSGPTGTTAPNPSGVTYEIYEDSATTVKVPNSAATVADGKVVFGTGITGSLDKNTDYYIKVTGNNSGYKDDSADVYKVQFGDDGKPKYYNSTTSQYETTPPTDKLIKNEGIQLNVTLEGDTSTGTDSNVKYNVYDSTGNPVLDSSVSATKGSSDTTYKVVVDTAVTTDKLNRQPAEYYIAIDTNGSGYDDKVPNEKFWVKFDNNGNAQYSTDKQTWSDTPLEDILVKAKDTSSEPTSQPANPPAGDSGSTGGTTNDGGSTSGTPENGGNGSNSGSAGSSTPETNNGGASNNAGNNTAGDNTNKGTTDGASDANATDSALTGSNAMDSAKTGELKTIYIFAGFASVIAIAAGVYVFIKRKRA